MSKFRFRSLTCFTSFVFGMMLFGCGPEESVSESSSALTSMGQLVPKPNPLEQKLRVQVEQLVTLLEGVLDNQQQAQSDPSYAPAKLTFCQVTVKNIPSYQSQSRFIYMGTSSTITQTGEEKSFIIQMQPNLKLKAISSTLFRAASDKSLQGICARPVEERSIEMKNLEETVCTYTMNKVGRHLAFTGESQVGGCPALFERTTIKTDQRISIFENTMEITEAPAAQSDVLYAVAQKRTYRFNRQTSQKSN